MQLHAEEDQQHDAGDELGNGTEAQACDAEDPVGQPPLAQSRRKAERQRDRDQQDEGEQGKRRAVEQTLDH